jgi:hypothetical protein
MDSPCCRCMSRRSNSRHFVGPSTRTRMGSRTVCTRTYNLFARSHPLVAGQVGPAYADGWSSPVLTLLRGKEGPRPTAEVGWIRGHQSNRAPPVGDRECEVRQHAASAACPAASGRYAGNSDEKARALRTGPRSAPPVFRAWQRTSERLGHAKYFSFSGLCSPRGPDVRGTTSADRSQ